MALFEVCLEGVDGAVAAERGGAGRIELCAALVEGGITPSVATIEACRDAVDLDIMVMIRPRSGDFCYSERELDVMHRDVEHCRRIGVTGVVFGCLDPSGSIAGSQVRALRETAGPPSVTFHRAFDVARDPFSALEALIDLRIDRVLTSGQAATVPEGLPLLRDLIARAAGRIGILPGCGITVDNVAEVVRELGVSEFHATAFAHRESPMRHRNEAVYMGIPGLSEYERAVTDEGVVRGFVEAVG